MKSNSGSTAENQFLIKKNNLWEIEMCGSTSEKCQRPLDHGRQPADGAWRPGAAGAVLWPLRPPAVH